MVLEKVTYTLPVLKNLVESKTSCVYCVENCQKCFNTSPALIGNLKVAINQHLASKIATYDTQLQGIIMSHKKIRIINSVQLVDNGDYKVDYIADIYIFKPTIGSILIGRVNKRSQDHIGVLVHSVFNASIPRPRTEADCPKFWSGSSVKIGEEVTLEVVNVKFMSKLPYIEGKLVDFEEKGSEDGDSGIGVVERSEEEAFHKGSDSSPEENIDKYSERKPEKNQKMDSVGDIQADLLEEILNISGQEQKGRKRKREEDSPRQATDVKRQRTLDLPSTSAPRTSIEDLISSEIASLRSQKKKRKSRDKNESGELPTDNQVQGSEHQVGNTRVAEAWNEGDVSGIGGDKGMTQGENFDASNKSERGEGKKEKKKKKGLDLEEIVSACIEEISSPSRIRDEGGMTKKEMKKSLEREEIVEVREDQSLSTTIDEAEMSEIKKKKKKDRGKEDMEGFVEDPILSQSWNEDGTTKKEKKKKKHKIDEQVQFDIEDSGLSRIQGEEGLTKEEKKKKKHKIKEQVEDNIGDSCLSKIWDEESMPKKEKKHKIEEQDKNNVEDSCLSKIWDEESMPKKEKKKKKHRTEVQMEDNLEDPGLSRTWDEGVTTKKEKKKKKHRTEVQMEDNLEDPGLSRTWDEGVTTKKEKKRKKHKLEEKLDDVSEDHL